MNNIEIKSIMIKVQQMFPNLYLEGNCIKGEINICAVYNGKRLICNPNVTNRESYKNTFVKDVFEIKIDLKNWKVYEVGNKIKRIESNHINPDDSCCLGLFTKNDSTSLLKFITNYVVPFFVWHAYKRKYQQTPPWGEWSHGEQGLEEFRQAKTHQGRNDICLCGSGKKYKNCCLKKITMNHV